MRYNRIEEGAHAIDLVEAEDFPVTALALPAYRTTHVIGNQILSGAVGYDALKKAIEDARATKPA